MTEAFDQDWYLDNVLVYASPGGPERAPRSPAEHWRAWWARAALDDAFTRAAARQGFVLLPAQLSALGVSRAATRTAVQHGRWFVPALGTVAPLDLRADTGHDAARRRHALRASAATLRRHGHVVSARSAAIMHGLPTLVVPSAPELTTARHVRLGPAPSVHIFGADLPATAVTTWFGSPITTVARTVVDLARRDRRDGLMAADAALRENLVTSSELDRAVHDAAGRPGVQQARAVLALASPQAESPLESITRLALQDSGFPPPCLQMRIGTDRVDFCWPTYGLILEADGRGKYVGDALWAEKKREHRLRHLATTAWVVERVVWADVVGDWPATVARLRPYFV